MTHVLNVKDQIPENIPEQMFGQLFGILSLGSEICTSFKVLVNPVFPANLRIFYDNLKIPWVVYVPQMGYSLQRWPSHYLCISVKTMHWMKLAEKHHFPIDAAIYSINVRWLGKEILLNEYWLDLINSIICKMGLLEMTERSSRIIFCSDITKFNELLTGPIPEYVCSGCKLNIVGATLTRTLSISNV